jgi:5-methyltetrahydrofolate--homocysteine methyltransferase
MEDFLSTIRERFVIGDGPMGTMLLGRHGNKYGTPEEFSVYEPEEVVRLHREYLEAGAEVLGANTLNANRVKLSRSKALDRLEEMNRLGVFLAKGAAESKAWIAGNMGPTGRLLEPLGELSVEEAREAYTEQASILAGAGADIIVIETMSDLEEAKAALEATRSVTRLPVVVSFSFDANIRTMMGVTPEQAARAVLEWGADLVGSNCGVGPDEVEQSAERMLKVAPGALLWTRPNAGLPRLEGDRTVYGIGPDRFADYAEKVASRGVRVIAACCGSTPEHVRAMSKRLAKLGQAIAQR